MKNLSVEQKEALLKTQSVLVKIANKQPVFFNTTNYTNLGLVKAYGKNSNNTTNWVLTSKGNMLISVVL